MKQVAGGQPDAAHGMEGGTERHDFWQRKLADPRVASTAGETEPPAYPVVRIIGNFKERPEDNKVKTEERKPVVKSWSAERMARISKSVPVEGAAGILAKKMSERSSH